MDRKITRIIWITLFLTFSLRELPLAQESDLEYKVKAVFLYNFTKFVEWPKTYFESNDPFTIGIAGKNKFGSALDVFKNKKIHGKPVRVVDFSLENVDYCHILFFTSTEEKTVTEILKSLGNKAILTVGQNHNFLELGGLINFLIIEGKIRFEINHKEALNSPLKFSSQLSALAVNAMH